MSTWSAEKLNVFGDAREMRVAGMRRDGSLRAPVIVWAVRLDDGLYTRSVNGPDAAWFRSTRPHHRGQISADGVVTEVEFVDVDSDDAVNDAIDAAYHRKYGRYPGPVQSITSALARSTTLEIVPFEPS
jgi:hypothetical protein